MRVDLSVVILGTVVDIHHETTETTTEVEGDAVVWALLTTSEVGERLPVLISCETIPVEVHIQVTVKISRQHGGCDFHLVFAVTILLLSFIAEIGSGSSKRPRLCGDV